MLESNFGVTFDCLLGDVANSRKLDPGTANKVDALVVTKRDKIHRWISESMSTALRSKGLRQIHSIPWKCLRKKRIQGHSISIKGWPCDIHLKRLMPKKDCETILTLIQAGMIEILLLPQDSKYLEDDASQPSNSTAI